MKESKYRKADRLIRQLKKVAGRGPDNLLKMQTEKNIRPKQNV